MNALYYSGNRERLYALLPDNAVLVVFSGQDVRKTNDEHYPFFADRSFVYLTGLSCKDAALLAVKTGEQVQERLYLLPADAFAERWTGTRIKSQEATAISGITDIRFTDAFFDDLHRLLTAGTTSIYLDLYRCEPTDRDRPAHDLRDLVQKEYPYLTIGNANALIRRLRTIKQPCEIEALRRAEGITREGILNMMKASKPGMYEYQYKAIFDYTLGQYGPEGPGFPSIISAGQNNFCIHYNAYTGQAQDGDMILNDVGAQYDNLIVDVSRGWPCSGKFTDRQRLLYECALKTSDYLFSIIKPGMKMADVDRTIRSFNAQCLVDAGVMGSVEEVGKYMWHGGAHHIGYDVHDVVETPEVLAPGMVFCVDVGIYHEAWGIGFRLEDNCLVTETGCENLSAAIPRTVEAIEAVMAK